MDAAFDEDLSKAKSHIPSAIEVLENIDTIYDIAEKRISIIHKYQADMSRQEYEAACAEVKTDILTDNECTSYGITYGNFSFPEYQPEIIVRNHLASRRGHQIQRIARAAEFEMRRLASPPLPPETNGQIWQECQRCGTEPVYLPLLLCTSCWPK